MLYLLLKHNKNIENNEDRRYNVNDYIILLKFFEKADDILLVYGFLQFKYAYLSLGDSYKLYNFITTRGGIND